MIFKRMFSRGLPRLDWIQVEVTSRCNAACIYCPRTAYRDSWQDRDLPLETFERLAPFFSRARHVHLQGWGEPFLHPGFFEMASMAKKAGCRVGTTTNAMVLHDEVVERIIETGIDTLAFSLAGTNEENDRIRKGTRIEKVLERIRRVSQEKERRKAPIPSIHVAYMLFRSGLERVEDLPLLLEGMGVSQVVITTLDFVPSRSLQEETILPATQAEFDALIARLEVVAQKGEELGLVIHSHIASPVRTRRVCTENVEKAVCIASDGAVTPCVFTNLQLSGCACHPNGEERPYERLVLGNVNEEALTSIWKTASYAAFRRSFHQGPLAPPCQGCPKLR